MTVRSIELYPTCDIHLLLEGPGVPAAPTTYQLEVRDYNDSTENLSALIDRTKYTDNNPAIATVSATGLITPVAVGETFCRIRHTDTDAGPPAKTFVSEIVVRIRVHQRLESLWLGNNRATLFRDESSYVLSVYGLFDDGTIGDISSHPYLTFDSAAPTQVEVNNTDDRGRLTGRAVTGASPVRVAVLFRLLSDEIDVSVVPPLSTTRPLLERIHGAGPPADRRNILFLAEGFPQGQRQLFRRIVTLLKDGLFTSSLHAPYGDLKDRFNVWMAFDPSPEEGISAGDLVVQTGTGTLGVGIGAPVSYLKKAPVAGNYDLRELVLRVGLPDRYRPIPTTRAAAETAWASTVAGTDFSAAKVEEDVVAAWLRLAGYHLLQARDSLLGIMNGVRYGDRGSTRVDPAATPDRVMHWYLADAPPHHLGVDRRRMARPWNPLSLRDSYIASLRPVGGGADVTGVWVGDGRDSQLVVFLVYSAFDGGTARSVGVRMSTSQNTRYTELHIAGRRADHSVPEIEVLTGLGTLLRSSLDEMVSVLAHELAHVFALNDEYEGESYAGTHDVLREDDISAREDIESKANLIHHFAVAKPPGDHGIIDIDRVKWTRWHRIERCSVLTEDPVVLGGGRLRIRIAPGDRAKWDTPSMHNFEVFLRARDINPADFDLEGPLKILEFQADGSLILATTSTDVFSAGDVLYLPRVERGERLTIFHPDVLLDLKAFEEPFALKADPSEPNSGPAYPPAHALEPNFKPRHPAFVVGVYEGGGTYNSRVYRASGACKMRETDRAVLIEKPRPPVGEGQPAAEPARPVKRFVPFCYVCRYAMVNALDPALLADLPYPE